MRHRIFTEHDPTERNRRPRVTGGSSGADSNGREERSKNMKRALALTSLAVATVAVAVVAGHAQPASAKQTAGSLVGTGSTFVYPLISKWIPAVDKAYGIKITYSPTGSGTGIAQVTARTVDFGATDAPLSPDQLKACNGCVVIPWGLAGLSVPYNIPGIAGRLRLDGPTLALIYLGKITNWNARAIQRLNPSLKLPDLRITPVYRSDSSGSTYAFTEFLSSVSPQWRKQVGFNTVVNFPAGTGARGSSGVTGVVGSTEGAVTYVDAAYAIANKIQFALIKNRAGGFRTPGVRDIQAALSQLPKKIKSLKQLKIVDPPKKAGKKAYPISTFTYVVVPTKSGSKAADLRKFLTWSVTQGQKFGSPLYFAPLPANVQQFAGRQIVKIKS
jgi:phosphate transport system substrate-binding protein